MLLRTFHGPLHKARHAPGSQRSYRSRSFSQQGIAYACVVKPVVTGDGFNGPGDRAAVDIDVERAPFRRWLLTPVRIVDARDFIQRSLLRVEA